MTIIIPSGGDVEVLEANLMSLVGKTSYPNYEILIADNSSHQLIEKLARQWKRKVALRSFDWRNKPFRYWKRRKAVRYFDWRNKPFNYSVINNRAAEQCNSPILLFLNDDTSVIGPDWLTAMVEQAMRPEVGAVGARLLYPDDRIQHAGVILGVFDNCGHAFKGLDGRRSHYFSFSDVIRNVSAVTGACLMIRAEIFRAVGGFDETEFAVAFNDIDLCLRIGAQGYRIIYTPHAQLYHHEAFSKTLKDLIPKGSEVAAMRARWKDLINADPFYNPNLTRTDEDYSLLRR